MRSSFNSELFAAMVRAKRGGQNLRDVSAEIGDVSPSTLSRIENKKMPDMDTFLSLCDWLNEPAATFFSQPTEAQDISDKGEQITVQLRADKNLDPATANVLATLVSAAYEQFGRKIETKED